eukprot:194177_1
MITADQSIWHNRPSYSIYQMKNMITGTTGKVNLFYQTRTFIMITAAAYCPTKSSWISRFMMQRKHPFIQENLIACTQLSLKLDKRLICGKMLCNQRRRFFCNGACLANACLCAKRKYSSANSTRTSYSTQQKQIPIMKQQMPCIANMNQRQMNRQARRKQCETNILPPQTSN